MPVMPLDDFQHYRAGPQPPKGQAIIDRAIALGATSPETARRRAELNPRALPGWPELLASGCMRQARDGYYYAVQPDGSEEHPFLHGLPHRVSFVLALLGIAIIALLTLLDRR